MRKMRRGRFWKTVVAVVLTLCMAFGVMPDIGALQVVKPVEVQAAGNPDFYCEAYNSKNPFAQSGWYGQCTWYAWGRAFELTGKEVPALGNAGTWLDAARNARWRVGDENSLPEANSIAVWSNGEVGHVAYVESVNGDSVTISEANWFTNSLKVKCYSVEEGKKWYNGISNPPLSTAQMRSRYGSTLLGYIYLGNPPPPPDPNIGKPLTEGYQTISDGDYFIVSALEGNRFNPGSKCLTIEGVPGTKDNNQAKAVLGSGYGDGNHVFTITWVSNGFGAGFYRIKLKDSAKQYLDAEGASLDMGTDVQQWEWHERSLAEFWRINETGYGDGYTIQSACNGWYVDVQDGKTADGTKIRLWAGNDSTAQRWYFIPYSGSGTAQWDKVPDGEYHIVPKLDTDKSLNVQNTTDGLNVNLWSSRNDGNHTFQVKELGDGYYEIVNTNTGYPLDVWNATSLRGANVGLHHALNHSFNQRWLLKSCGDGYFYIISKCNGLYLDVEDSKTTNGTNVSLFTGHGRDNQKWRFVPWNPSVGKTIEDGEYQLLPRLDEGKSLSVQDDGVGAKDGTNIELNSRKGDGRHTFDFTYLGDGYYRITNRETGLVLDAAGGGWEAGSNVQLWSWVPTGPDTQKWMVKPSGNGYFYIISKCGGLHLELYWSLTADRTNIQLWTGWNGECQQWKLAPFTSTVAATSVTLDKTTLSLTTGGRATLTATVSPVNSTDKAVTWVSSNPDVASVDGSGIVTANQAGTATITASASNGKSATCTVTVAAAHVHSYGNSWKTGSGSHWKECSCGARAEEAAHILGWVTDRDATVESAGVKHEECQVCGYRQNEGTVIPKLPSPQEPRMRGDIDGDGQIGLKDLMRCLYHISGGKALEGEALKAADVDGDGTVGLKDLMRLLYYVSGSRGTL